MIIKRKYFWRYSLLAVAAIGILVYLLSPMFGWMLGSVFQRTTALYPAPEVEVLGQVILDEKPREVPVAEFSHYVLELNYMSGGFDEGDLAATVMAERPLLITVQTWSGGSNSYSNNPLLDIKEGKYDDLLGRLLGALPQGGEGVYLRFNPEMEVPVDDYPWQQYPSIYIEAYRKFALLCDRLAPKAVRIWAPAGYPGALEYYPGDDVVDAASVTFGYQGEQQLSAYPKNLPAEEELYRRLHRLRFLSVPVYVIRSAPGESREPDLGQVVKRLQQAPPGTYGKQITLSEVDRYRRPHRQGEVTVGLYDPQQRLLHSEHVSAEHLFVDFRSIEDGSFDSLFRATIGRGHTPIVSFEPFFAPGEVKDTNVLANVTMGQYDGQLRRLNAVLGSTSWPVYFRYAHEMEIPIHRYPWQSQDPHTYIASFRYVMDPGKLPRNVQRIWGPAGDRGSLEWYPGDDYVDLISIAVYGLPDKNITDPRQQEQFATVFDRKMWRMRFVDKPVFITEFGVKGPEEYQTHWLIGAGQTLRKDDRVVGVNYFNMSDTPKAWGDIKPPDWSITPATLEEFIVALAGDPR